MRHKLIRLTDREAAAIATAELGYRVPRATVRSWKNRGKVTGGQGWIEGASLVEHLDRTRHDRRTACKTP